VTRLALVAAWLAWFAGADARAGVTVETYFGARSPDAERVAGKLVAALAERGIDASAAHGAAQLDHVAKSAVADPALTGKQLAEQLELAHSTWIRGEFVSAAQRLADALQVAHDNPGIVITSDGLVSAVIRAQVDLALARRRLEDPAGARDAMMAYVRAYPDRPVARREFGPDAESYYASTKAVADRASTGVLVVDVTDPDAQIFVDEIGRGRGASYSAHLLAGEYRVVVIVGSVARRYDVTVAADRESRLSIDWRLDAALATGAATLQLALSRDELATQASYARALSRAAHDARVVILFSVDTASDGVLAATLYDGVTSRVVRTGRARLGAGEDREIATLAGLLASGQSDAAITARDASERAARSGPRWPSYVGIGAAAAAAGSGIYLLHINHEGTCGLPGPTQCPKRWATAPAGWSLLGAGAVLAAASIWWFVHSGQRAPEVLAIVPARDGIALAWQATW
jgi:hypothetical protein